MSNAHPCFTHSWHMLAVATIFIAALLLQGCASLIKLERNDDASSEVSAFASVAHHTGEKVAFQLAFEMSKLGHEGIAGLHDCAVIPLGWRLEQDLLAPGSRTRSRCGGQEAVA